MYRIGASALFGGMKLSENVLDKRRICAGNYLVHGAQPGLCEGWDYTERDVDQQRVLEFFA
jgi:hypothetical protein